MGETGGPMKRHWFHILLALSGRRLHGAGIVRDVLEQTSGELRLWPVTLYGSLEELSEAGLIEELEEEERPEGVSERRRYYRITEPGRRRLSEEGERLRGLAAEVSSRLGEVG